jgi:hypothetical protein
MGTGRNSLYNLPTNVGVFNYKSSESGLVPLRWNQTNSLRLDIGIGGQTPRIENEYIWEWSCVVESSP